MADGLKNCPFCGGEAGILAVQTGKNRFSYTPRCLDRSCCGRISKSWVDLDTAKYAWNRRAKAAEPGEDLSFCEKTETFPDCTVQIISSKEYKVKRIVWWRNDE